MKNNFNKSPFNYIGGKYKMLPQIMKYFPGRVNHFLDLFCGGCDVCSNMQAGHIYANDINFLLIQIFEAFKSRSVEELLSYIDQTIAENGLNMTDKQAYNDFRDYYNRTRNPLDLYILVCYSFNYQFRFNGEREYNNPFGKNRSSFNPAMRRNLITFHEKIQNICFSSRNFREYDYSFLGPGDFVYADPPYRITTGSYNDGKRGFEGWSEEDDLALCGILDELGSRGVKFALSNVTEHKGIRNEVLMKWKRDYHTHRINYNYNHSSYQAKNVDKVTKEVLITNY